MKNIAVFASGSGTNFQAIIDSVNKGKLQTNSKLLVCDRPGAQCIERAVKANIPTFTFSAKDFASKKDYETEILQRLLELNIDYIILAGYMRLIGSTLLQAFEGKIINIHHCCQHFQEKMRLGRH